MADDASLSLAAPPAPAPKRFTWPEVLAMADAGLFEEGARVELIGGEVFAMPPEGPRHADMVHTLEAWLRANLPPTLRVFVRAPVILPDGVVVPDLSVFPAGTKAAVMVAQHAALIVEVADSTLRHDLNRKEPRYRAAGVSELWIAAAEGPTLWVRRDPAEEGWRFQKAFGANEAAAPACAPAALFAVASLAADDT